MTERVLNALFMLLFASNPRRVARARASFVTMWMDVLVSVPMLSHAEGLLYFDAIKLTLLLLFLITTFVHKTASTDSAENRINGHLNTQHSLYSH